MATKPTMKPSSLNRNHRSTYLGRVEEAMSRSFLKMEPYDGNAYIQKTNTAWGSSEGLAVKRGSRLPFYPHVELGTAPIEVEHIDDLQKIRPFGVGTNQTIAAPNDPTSDATTSGDSTNRNFPKRVPKQSDSIDKEHYCGSKDLSATTATIDPTKAVSPATTRKRESCLIESTTNSVRISFLFKAQANFDSKASADPLEGSILFQWMRFLMVQEEHPLLRKKPIKGYSVTFLVTNKHLAVHGRRTVEDSILEFCARIDKECSDIKLQVNAQARYVTTEFLKAFNNQTTTGLEAGEQC